MLKAILSTVVCLLVMQLNAQLNYPALYPKAAKSTDTIFKFGHTVCDPYRGMEDMDSKQTKDWVSKQGEIIRQYRNSVYGRYSEVEKELVYTVFNSNGYSPHNKTSAYYFYDSYASIEDNAPFIKYKEKLTYGWKDLTGTRRFLRDKKDFIEIKFLSVSKDDSILAIGVSHGGGDWIEVRLIDMNTHNFYSDTVNWVKSGIEWAGDGFFYKQYERPTGNEISGLSTKSAVYYHKLGDNSGDKMVSGLNDYEKDFYTLSKGKFMVLFERKMQNGKPVGYCSYMRTDSVGLDTLKTFMMAPQIEAKDFQVIGESKGMFYVQSNYKAPHGRIMQYDYAQVNPGRQLVEMYNQTLHSAVYLHQKLFCVYNDKGNYLFFVFDDKGTLLKSVQIPSGMGVSVLPKVFQDSIVYYNVNSFAMPPVTMRLNLNTLKSELADVDVGASFSSKYITKVVSYKSKDSTDIYMYVTYNKDLELDGNIPTLIYAYGGFGIPTEPQYNPCYGMLLKRKCAIAVPLIRGGGEFGTDWHNAGRKRNKQKSVEDVAAAAEWLIANKYTNPSKLAITGGSQGGWLMGDVAVQYPQLFKAVVPIAGVYDMLRFHMFSSSGDVGLPEFGDPDDSLDFASLLKISPVHNVTKGVNYPAAMVIIGSRDNRVVPFHSYKFVAALQENATTTTPYLLYQEENAGHNVSNSMGGLQQLALTFTFIMDMLGVHVL